MAPVLARCSALRCAATTRRPVAAVASRPSVCRRRSTVACRAELNQGPLANVQAQLDGFFKRYDVLSCGAGALFVTSYCVFARGQDAWTALSITFTSTVVALVANELINMSSSNKQ